MPKLQPWIEAEMEKHGTREEKPHAAYVLIHGNLLRGFKAYGPIYDSNLSNVKCSEGEIIALNPVPQERIKCACDKCLPTAPREESPAPKPEACPPGEHDFQRSARFMVCTRASALFKTVNVPEMTTVCVDVDECVEVLERRGEYIMIRTVLDPPRSGFAMLSNFKAVPEQPGVMLDPEPPIVRTDSYQAVLALAEDVRDSVLCEQLNVIARMIQTEKQYGHRTIDAYKRTARRDAIEIVQLRKSLAEAEFMSAPIGPEACPPGGWEKGFDFTKGSALYWIRAVEENLRSRGDKHMPNILATARATIVDSLEQAGKSIDGRQSELDELRDKLATTQRVLDEERSNRLNAETRAENAVQSLNLSQEKAEKHEQRVNDLLETIRHLRDDADDLLDVADGALERGEK